MIDSIRDDLSEELVHALLKLLQIKTKHAQELWSENDLLEDLIVVAELLSLLHLLDFSLLLTHHLRGGKRSANPTERLTCGGRGDTWRPEIELLLRL